MPEKYNRKYFVQKIFYDEDENSFKLHRSQNDDDGSYVHQINKALQTCNILGIKSLQDVKKIVINDTTCSRFAFLSYQYDGVEMSNKSHKVTNIDTLNYILQHDDDEFELIHLSINECVRAIICQNSKIKLNCAYPIAIDDFFTLGLLQFILLMKKDFEDDEKRDDFINITLEDFKCFQGLKFDKENGIFLIVDNHQFVKSFVNLWPYFFQTDVAVVQYYNSFVYQWFINYIPVFSLLKGVNYFSNSNSHNNQQIDDIMDKLSLESISYLNDLLKHIEFKLQRVEVLIDLFEIEKNDDIDETVLTITSTLLSKNPVMLNYLLDSIAFKYNGCNGLNLIKMIKDNDLKVNINNFFISLNELNNLDDVTLKFILTERNNLNRKESSLFFDYFTNKNNQSKELIYDFFTPENFSLIFNLFKTCLNKRLDFFCLLKRFTYFKAPCKNINTKMTNILAHEKLLTFNAKYGVGIYKKAWNLPYILQLMLDNNFINNNQDIINKLKTNSIQSYIYQLLNSKEDNNLDFTELYKVNKEIFNKNEKYLLYSPKNTLDIIVHQTLLNKDLTSFFTLVVNKLAILLFLKDKNNNIQALLLDDKNQILSIVNKDEIVDDVFIKEIQNILSKDSDISSLSFVQNET